jgi:hypothetical protein
MLSTRLLWVCSQIHHFCFNLYLYCINVLFTIWMNEYLLLVKKNRKDYSARPLFLFTFPPLSNLSFFFFYSKKVYLRTIKILWKLEINIFFYFHHQLNLVRGSILALGGSNHFSIAVVDDRNVILLIKFSVNHHRTN